jgi:pimeloyl-ACP methyl ester carboxylesterase
MHEAYARVAPEPANWPALVAKTGELLRKEYDWSDDVAAISAPTLIAVGDRDSFSPAHAVEMFALLGGARAGGDSSGPSSTQLAILPGTSHFDILSPALIPIVSSFLQEPTHYEQEPMTETSAAGV